MKSIDSKVLILHDIRSAQNVGSLFRTADAAGIDCIYLSGITPSPIDRFGRPEGAIAKTALGAEKTIMWQTVADIDLLLKKLKEEAYTIVSIEQHPMAVDYKTVSLSGSVAFMLGNEIGGLPDTVLNVSDHIAEISMRGTKESLNVSVAGGVALFRMLNI